MKSKVIVAVCPDYNEDRVYSCVSDAVSALGGIEKFVSKNEKILVKPNFLSAAKGEQCITTHPSVIRALLRLLSENSYTSVKIGDSPAVDHCSSVFTAVGLSKESLYGAEMAKMNEECLFPFPDGKKAKSFYFTKDVAEADAIIGVCKMKTHALERVTGAVKNMFGLICGKRKALNHVAFPTASDFAMMLADIHRCVKPRLHIMDAVTAMEGNGPASGTPVHMGLIIASSDPVAIDAVFCRLVNLDPVLVPTNTQCARAGVGTYKDSEIELCLIENGSTTAITMDALVSRFGKPDFSVQREKDSFNILSFWSHLTGSFTKRPYIDKSMCVKCGNCVAQCPVEGHAVTFKNGRDNFPVYDYTKCIRCFCCQEICPQHAIKVRN